MTDRNTQDGHLDDLEVETTLEFGEITLPSLCDGVQPLNVDVDVAGLIHRDGGGLSVDEVVDLVTRLHAIFHPAGE